MRVQSLEAMQAESNKWYALRALATGTIVKLTNGETAEFVRLKQKKFIGIMNGGSYDIPVTMFVEVVSTPEKKDPIQQDYRSLKRGDAFYIDSRGKALLYFFEEFKNGQIIGINPVEKCRTRIPFEMYAGKVSDYKM